MPTRRTAPSDAQRPGRRAHIRTRRRGVAIGRRRGSAYRLLLQPMPNQPNLCAATPVRQPQADAHVDGWDLRAVERAGISERRAASTMGGRRRTRGSKRDGRAHAGAGRSFANGWPHPERPNASRTFPRRRPTQRKITSTKSLVSLSPLSAPPPPLGVAHFPNASNSCGAHHGGHPVEGDGCE